MSDSIIAWLLSSAEPWTRYRTLVDLLGRPQADAGVQAARAQMLSHPELRDLMARASHWGKQALKRHNDAAHPIYALSTLADFGLRAEDPGMDDLISGVLARQASEGPFQSLVSIPKAFGGSGDDTWAWMACDSPTLLYALLAFGLGDDERVQRAVQHLAGAVQDNGWRCLAAPELGRFRGPGRRDDPCPIANVYALKALALAPAYADGAAARAGAEMLLQHWARRKEWKPFLFGAGTDYRKLKYPYVWYDLLHVLEVLSRCHWLHGDSRFQEMVDTLRAQADGDGRYRAGSMYLAWKGWSFADKKAPSPWLTLLAWRILGRVA